MINKYGYCDICKCPLEPIWFVEEEYTIDKYKNQIKTGRKKHAVDYLICPNCLKRYCIDDSFDGDWF